MFEECRIEGDFTLSSGRKSAYFYDFDLLLPREAATYTELLLQSIHMDTRKDIDFVACPAIGGVVPGFLIAFALTKPLVIVDHDGIVRGPEFKTGRYLVVDDVCTSFKAANRVRGALHPKTKCLAIASYIFRGNGRDLKEQDVPVYYLERKEEEE